MRGKSLLSWHSLLCCINHHFLPIGAVKYDQTFFVVAKGLASRSTQLSTNQSGAPFPHPTSHPSETPTSLPTLECHDSSTYQNPLDPLLRCEHHRNTPCRQWKYLGLSEIDIEALISSCPISCNAPCRSTISPSSPPKSQPNILLFYIEISIYLYPVTELIDEGEFQKLSLNYLSSYLSELHATRAPSLVSFVVNSQNFVTRRVLRHNRGLKNSSTVKLVATVGGEGGDIVKEELSREIHTAMEREDYIEALHALSDVEITSVSSSSPLTFEADEEIVEPSSGSNTMSPGATAAIAVSLVLVACIIISIVIYRKRISLQYFKDLSPSNGHNFFDQDTPINKGVVGQSNSSKLTTNSSGGIHHPSRSQLQLNQSKNIFHLRVDECEMKKTVRTSSSASFSESDSPPVNIIPPMIVIDNIDDEILNNFTSPARDEEEGSNNKNKDGVMRLTNLGASSTLATSFSAHKRGNSIHACLENNFFYLKESAQQESQNDSEMNGKSPLSLISSRPSIGDTASAFSTPASVMTGPGRNKPNESPSKKKGVFTFDPNIDMEPEDDFTVLFEKKMKEGGKRSFNLKDFFKRNKPMEEEEERSSVQMSHYESDAELSDISSVVRRKDRLTELGQQETPPQSKLFLQETQDSTSMVDKEYVIDGIDKKTPAHDSNEHIPNQSLDEKISSSGSHNRIASDESFQPTFFYTFEAPISGKLGIIIHTTIKPKFEKHGTAEEKRSLVNMRYGPTVYEIKGYSPLLGMVQPGDIIISVDGVNTKNMSTGEITTLLQKKRSEKGENEGKIKITVMSDDLKPGFEPESIDGHLFENTTTESLNSSSPDRDENDSRFSSESDRSFHLIGTGMSDEDDDDSFHMMAGSEDFL